MTDLENLPISFLAAVIRGRNRNFMTLYVHVHRKNNYYMQVHVPYSL